MRLFSRLGSRKPRTTLPPKHRRGVDGDLLGDLGTAQASSPAQRFADAALGGLASLGDQFEITGGRHLAAPKHVGRTRPPASAGTGHER